jgi:hypothetical protein
MNFDDFEQAVVRPHGIRNPANLKVTAHRTRAVAASMPRAARLEHLGLAFLITAVASVLPLVMMLHQ